MIRRFAAMESPPAMLALVRKGSDTGELKSLGVATHECDFSDPDTYLEQFPTGATFVGLSNLRHCDSMMPHLVRKEVARCFCVTTTAVFSSFHSYANLYVEIEDRLRSAPIPMTLLRPSMIYGNARDHNMSKLVRTLDRLPVFPVFGSGTALMQPVYVDDLVDGIVAAVRRNAIGEFNLAGPTPLSYNDLLATVSSALGRKVPLIHVNHGLAARLVSALERVPGFPIKHEQVMRLLEDKAFDISSSVRQLGYTPRNFDVGIAQQVAEYRSLVS